MRSALVDVAGTAHRRASWFRLPASGIEHTQRCRCCLQAPEQGIEDNPDIARTGPIRSRSRNVELIGHGGLAGLFGATEPDAAHDQTTFVGPAKASAGSDGWRTERVLRTEIRKAHF